MIVDEIVDEVVKYKRMKRRVGDLENDAIRNLCL